MWQTYSTVTLITFVFYMIVFRRAKDNATLEDDFKLAAIASLCWCVSIPIAIKAYIDSRKK